MLAGVGTILLRYIYTFPIWTEDASFTLPPALAPLSWFLRLVVLPVFAFGRMFGFPPIVVRYGVEMNIDPTSECVQQTTVATS